MSSTELTSVHTVQMKHETDSETMNDPFSEASSYYFTVDESSLGEYSVDLFIDGYIHSYDRIHIILLDGQFPIAVGMYAIEDDGEKMFAPADTYSMARVERIANPLEDAERLTDV